MNKLFPAAVLLCCAAYAAFLAYVNVDAVIGSYGDGPPYYGRTTNMDKWENPLPTLALLDIASAIALFVLARWAWGRIRLPPNKS